MDALLPILSLALAVVFAVAGLGKLLDRAGSRAAARGFGVPDRLAGGVAVGLPLAELAVAALLLPSATRWWGAVAALTLLVLFCAVVTRAIVRGESPDCHCFGQLHSAPAGLGTLARNGALAIGAVLLTVAGRDDSPPDLFAWTAGLSGRDWLLVTLGAFLTLALAAAGYAVVHVMRSYGQVLLRLEQVEARLRAAGFDLEEPDDVPALGLEPGTRAPMFWLPDLHGDRVALDDLLQRGHPLLLVFTSPSCGSCAVLMPTVACWQQEHAHELTIALLNEGNLDRIRAEAARHGLENVLIDQELAAYSAYRANGTPSAVLVAADGTIASWLAAGSEWIETLVEQALDEPKAASGLPVGAEVPELTVEVLDIGPRLLRELIDRPTVMLFWNPNCGFCRSMRDELAAWEVAEPREAPRLLVVFAGAPDVVRAEGFAADVVLDPNGEIAAQLGAHGTPMAVLVDAEGRIASPLAAGGEQALGLLAPRAPALAE